MAIKGRMNSLDFSLLTKGRALRRDAGLCFSRNVDGPHFQGDGRDNLTGSQVLFQQGLQV